MFKNGCFKCLQTEGVEVSAEMDFLGQQNIMLDLENKALKQRLESLSQEHLIKRCKYDISLLYSFTWVILLQCFLLPIDVFSSLSIILEWIMMFSSDFCKAYLVWKKNKFVHV